MFSQTNSKILTLLGLLFVAAAAVPTGAKETKNTNESAEIATQEEKAENKPTEKTESGIAKEGANKPNREGKPVKQEPKTGDPDDKAVAKKAEDNSPAVARPVSPDLNQVYGWREEILIDGFRGKIDAKLDTGAYTSSIHAEEKELFEREGKKWVRFFVTEPSKKNSPRVRVEAPLIRIAKIKNPGAESETREVVRLSFKIGERKMRGEFTLNNRSNMLSAVLIGRTMICELGLIDSSRTNLADKKIMR